MLANFLGDDIHVQLQTLIDMKKIVARPAGHERVTAERIQICYAYSTELASFRGASTAPTPRTIFLNFIHPK